MSAVLRVGSSAIGRLEDHPRLVHRLLAASIAALLLANAWAFVEVGTRVTPVSVDSAVARFRSLAAAAPRRSESSTEGLAAGAEAAAAPAAADGGSDTSNAHGSATSATAAGRATVTPAAGAPAAAKRPTSGVYVYATSGFEEVSIAGGRHDYPSQTTMTVTPAPCGIDVRWDVFQQRWDRWTLCTPGQQLEVHQFETYHEFFGQVEHRSYDCAPGTDFRPASDQPGTRTSGRCQSGGAVVDMVATVVGIEDMAVGSAKSPALHVRVDETLTGDTRGTRSSDSWYAMADGLLLRRTAATSVDTEAVFGSTHYTEELRLDLTSLEPRS